MFGTLLCPTFCDPMNCSLPGTSVQEILQKEYWSGLSCPPPGDLPNREIEPTSPESPVLQENSLPTEPPGKHLENIVPVIFIFIFQ